MPTFSNLDRFNAGAGDLNYVHNQLVASNTWIVNHNLGKFPSVDIVDSAGNLVETCIQHIDNNSFISSSNNPFSGKAYVN